MKKEFSFEYDMTENAEVINSLKYSYFGKAYSVINSKKSLQEKKNMLNDIIAEIENDPLLNVGDWKYVKSSILHIIYGRLSNIEYWIDVKKFKKR